MADEPKPVNYFSEDAPGETMQESVENEKMKLLRLVAEHGSTGQRIYDEAIKRSNASQTDTKSTVSKGAPVSVIKEVADEFNKSLSTFNQILEDNARAAKQDTIRRQSIEAIYKDSVAGDASLEAAAQANIDAFTAQQAAAASSGGGGGSSSSAAPSPIPGQLTIPEDYLYANTPRIADDDPRHGVYGPGGHAMGHPTGPLNQGPNADLAPTAPYVSQSTKPSTGGSGGGSRMQ